MKGKVLTDNIVILTECIEDECGFKGEMTIDELKSYPEPYCPLCFNGLSMKESMIKTKMDHYKKGKYNHAFDIAFEVISDNEEEHVTKEELFEGLFNRISSLIKNGDEILEACGMPFDTYDMDED